MASLQVQSPCSAPIAVCVWVSVCTHIHHPFDSTHLIRDSDRPALLCLLSVQLHHPITMLVLLCLYCCPLSVCACVCWDGCACRRRGRDGYVLTRRQQQQQQQPVETKAGWFIALCREHKSHLQCRAFKRPASWQHLPFINDWAEPPMEPENTKLTHSPSNSSFVSPLSPHLSLSFHFFPSPIYLTHTSVPPSLNSESWEGLFLSKYPPTPFISPSSSYQSPPWPPSLHLRGMMGYSHHIAQCSPSVYICRGYIAKAA